MNAYSEVIRNIFECIFGSKQNILGYNFICKLEHANM